MPAFEEPKSRNAATTLVVMGLLATTMFAGITALALAADVHMAEDPAALIGFHGDAQRTALSQIGLATFGETAPFFLLQAFTAAILILAANTAFNGYFTVDLAAMQVEPRRTTSASTSPNCAASSNPTRPNRVI